MGARDVKLHDKVKNGLKILVILERVAKMVRINYRTTIKFLSETAIENP